MVGLRLEKYQWFAALTVGLMALLAVPLYLLVAVLTIPIGLGVHMLFNDSPWVLNLYPFMYAGTMPDRVPIYYFNHTTGVVLTLVQWAVLAWLFGCLVGERWTRTRVVCYAAGLLAVVALVSATLLHVAGLQAVTEVPRM